MTTEAAAQFYLAQHKMEMYGRKFAVYNPHNKPTESLPVIYGFNNGGSAIGLSAVAIAEDGTVLGGHCCSNESYMPHDLGMLENTRLDRHEESYQKHCPDGYRMEFVQSQDIDNHEGLMLAIKSAQEKSRTEQ